MTLITRPPCNPFAVDFLQQYSRQNTSRTLRSSSTVQRGAVCTPVGGGAGGGKEEEEDQVCIYEVTADNFHQVVMDKHKVRALDSLASKFCWSICSTVDKSILAQLNY